MFGAASKTTKDGLESHFGINHLAHFLVRNSNSSRSKVTCSSWSESFSRSFAAPPLPESSFFPHQSTVKPESIRGWLWRRSWICCVHGALMKPHGSATMPDPSCPTCWLLSSCTEMNTTMRLALTQFIQGTESEPTYSGTRGSSALPVSCQPHSPRTSAREQLQLSIVLEVLKWRRCLESTGIRVGTMRKASTSAWRGTKSCRMHCGDVPRRCWSSCWRRRKKAVYLNAEWSFACLNNNYSSLHRTFWTKHYFEATKPNDKRSEPFCNWRYWLRSLKWTYEHHHSVTSCKPWFIWKSLCSRKQPSKLPFYVWMQIRMNSKSEERCLFFVPIASKLKLFYILLETAVEMSWELKLRDIPKSFLSVVSFASNELFELLRAVLQRLLASVWHLRTLFPVRSDLSDHSEVSGNPR